MQNLRRDKKSLRAKYKAVRDNIDADIRRNQDIVIFQKFFEMSEYKRAKTIFIYVSFGSEVETKRIIERIISDGKYAVVPKCDKKNHTMRTFKIDCLSRLKKGAYGIAEPCEDCVEVPKEQIDLAVVPGLCFDIKGNRLGYGGGYYDRFLADFKGFAVGLSYNECIIDIVPTDEYDCRLDLIISADGM